MADMKIPYLVIKRGLAFWQPTSRSSAAAPARPTARISSALEWELDMLTGQIVRACES